MRDYEAAALRHYRDAERLAAAQAFENACHLMGLAAECALKKGAGGFTRPKDAEIIGHLPQIKAEVRLLLQGRGAQGRLLQFAADRVHFSDWSVNDRYEADGYPDAVKYTSWKASARAAFVAASIRWTPANSGVA